MWDASHFPRARRVAYAIVNVVTRDWIGYLLTAEQSSTQAQLLFAQALEDQGLLDPDGRPRPARTGSRGSSRCRTTERTAPWCGRPEAEPSVPRR